MAGNPLVATSQPQQEQLIDRGSPLSKGLICCVTPQNRVRDATGAVALARSSAESLQGFNRASGVATKYTTVGFNDNFTVVSGAADASAGPDGWWALGVEGVFTATPTSFTYLIVGTGLILRGDAGGTFTLLVAGSPQVTTSNTIAVGDFFRLSAWGHNLVTNNITLNGVTTTTVDSSGWGGLGVLGSIGGQSGFGTINAALSQVSVWQGLSPARNTAWLANPWGMFKAQAMLSGAAVAGAGFVPPPPPLPVYGSYGDFATDLLIKSWF